MQSKRIWRGPLLYKFVYYYLYGSLIRLPSTLTEITALLAKLNRGEKVEMLRIRVNKTKELWYYYMSLLRIKNTFPVGNHSYCCN